MNDVIYRKDAAKILCNWCGVCPEDKRDIMKCEDICPEFAKIPSAQQWIPPRRCIDCENFNKTQLLVPQAQQKWVPCSERLPDDGTYLCWEWQGFCYVDSFKDGNWETAEKCYTKCIAWMPLPEPYKEGENG